MIQYSYQVAKLAKRREANGLNDVITSVTIPQGETVYMTPGEGL